MVDVLVRAAIAGAVCAWLGHAPVAAGEPARVPGVKSDRRVYAEPPLPKLPEAGGTYVDPTFGTTIMRLTDAADGKSCHHSYSYYPSFNKNNTRLFVCCDGRPALYRFDPHGFKVLGKEPLFAGKLPSGHQPRWEDAIWSDRDADVLFCHEGLRLWSYHVGSDTYRLVKDFSGLLPPGHLAQMSKSLDDDVFACSRQDPRWRVVGFLVWRRGEDKIVLQDDLPPEGLDEVQIDKTGRYLVIKSARQGKGVVQVRVADLATGKIAELIDNQPDFAPGHSDNGRGTVLGADNRKNRLTFRRLASPHQVRTVLELHNDWSQDYHVSLLAENEEWALVSFYTGNKLPSSGIFRNEIVQVATDGSRRVRRLAHHRTVCREYWDSPRANISRDGRLVVYTSNFSGRARRDVFILRVPPTAERSAPENATIVHPIPK
ncbi:MAG: hypothetical protein ACYSWU_18050 [Planctomycetota bacterium]|jgi:hypothetical protein